MADYTQFSILIPIGFEGLKKLNLPTNGNEENRQLRDIVNLIVTEIPCN